MKKKEKKERKAKTDKVKQKKNIRVLGQEGVFDVKLFDSYIERLRGLEFVEPDDYTYYFRECRSIHTFGMRNRLDVAFVSLECFILEVHKNVGPNRILKNPDAFGVFERFASEEPWFVEDELVSIDVDMLKEGGMLSDEELSRL